MKYLMRSLVLFVVAFSLVLSGPLAPSAKAEDGYSYGPVSDSVLLKLSKIKTVWWQCSVVGFWKVAAGREHLVVSGGCEQGAFSPDKDGWLFADVPECGRVSVFLGNLDQDDETGSFSELELRPEGGADTGSGCGAPSQLCLATLDPNENPELVNGQAETRCGAWNVGAPPDEQDPWYNTSASGCTSFSPLEPWVSDYEPVSVSGGWAWRSTVTINATYTDPPAALGAYAPTPRLVASVSAAGGVPETLNPDTGAWQSTPGPQAGTWIADAFYTFRSPGGWTADQSRSIRYTGPTLTGAVGAQPVNWQWRGAGLYWGANTITANTSTHPEAHSTRPSLAAINGDSGEYAAHHDPERCHFWWGTDVWPTDTSGYDTPGGPLVLRGTVDPPTPVTVVTTPPVIHVGPGSECPSGADACVDPGGDVDPDDEAPPSVPDPDDESCNFSITDPTTWGGQLICALVSVAGAIIDAILGIVDGIVSAILGLLDGLLELLQLLFVPDGDLWSGLMDSLQGMWDDGPGGEWAEVFAPPGGGESLRGGPSTFAADLGGGEGTSSFSSASTSSCEGPAIPLDSLGLPAEVGAPDEMHPFDACSGTSATVAENVRKWTGIGLVLGGGFKIFEMIVGAFGAMRQVKIMSSHDWTGPSSGRF